MTTKPEAKLYIEQTYGPKALAFFLKVYERSKEAFASASEEESSPDILRKIVADFGGEVWNTGGWVMVGFVPFKDVEAGVDMRACIGISEECVGIHSCEKPESGKDALDIAYKIVFYNEQRPEEDNKSYMGYEPEPAPLA